MPAAPPPEPGTEPDLAHEPGTEPDPAHEPGTEPDPAPESGTEPDPAPEPGTEPDPAPEPGTEPDPAPEPGTEPDPAPESGTVPGPGPEPRADSECGAASGSALRVPQLLEAMRSVGSGLELRTTLDRICETAAGLAGARFVAIRVVSEEGDGLSDLVLHGADEKTARRIGRLPDGYEDLLGALIRAPEPEPDREPHPVPPADPSEEPRSVGSPGHHPPAGGFLGVPIRVRGEIFGYLYLAEKHGGGTFDDGDLAMVRVLATEAGIAVGNARLYEEAKQRERWIDGSVAVTTALLSGGDADEALQVVAEQARRLSGAAAGIVLLPEEEGGLEVVAVAPQEPSGLLGTVVPADSEIVAELLGGRVVFVADAATDARMLTRHASGYGPTMLVPLQSDGRVLGTLVTPRARGGRPFTRAECTLAEQFASQAALALMMAEAQRDRERLAVYEDRDRIARDLHDLVIQRLFATGLVLESARRRSRVPEVREGVGKAVAELDVTIQEIRTAIFALRQEPAEAPAGLRTRVLREINMAAVPLGFKPAHHIVGPVDTAVGDLIGTNLIAALREALSNAFRHAGASRIDVTVDATATLPDGRPGVRLAVADDGAGIPEGGRRSGLRNLKRRAESLGGDSRLGPGTGEDGGGTTVVWEVPYPRDAG